MRHIQSDPTGDQLGTSKKWDFTTAHTKPAPMLLWKIMGLAPVQGSPTFEASVFPGWEGWEEGFTCTALGLQKAKAKVCCNVLPPHPSIWEHQYWNGAGRAEQPDQLAKAHLTLTSLSQNHKQQKMSSFCHSPRRCQLAPTNRLVPALGRRKHSPLVHGGRATAMLCSGQGRRVWGVAGAAGCQQGFPGPFPTGALTLGQLGEGGCRAPPAGTPLAAPSAARSTHSGHSWS